MMIYLLIFVKNVILNVLHVIINMINVKQIVMVLTEFLFIYQIHVIVKKGILIMVKQIVKV